MRLLGEILSRAGLHAWRKLYLGLQEPHAKAITQHKQWFEGDEVEVAGVANSQEVTTSGDKAQWEVCPPWWTLGKTIKMNCFS